MRRKGVIKIGSYGLVLEGLDRDGNKIETDSFYIGQTHLKKLEKALEIQKSLSFGELKTLEFEVI